jgi:hypothetical protein
MAALAQPIGEAQSKICRGGARRAKEFDDQWRPPSRGLLHPEAPAGAVSASPFLLDGVPSRLSEMLVRKRHAVNLPLGFAWCKMGGGGGMLTSASYR